MDEKYSVILMIAFMLMSVIMALFKASTVLVSTASAQIFDSILLGPTDQASVAAAGYVPGFQMFDKTVPLLGTPHGDYGIMILDKMLRQGIATVGGPTQNALGGLMQIYNTGVLVIAGIMLFWAVLSIVVDTARTGQLGGGRHNMVWAPMRIVFALGLLIPLGASGFSSGQFMVMKLAEWGSNWGTHAWVEYVKNVVNQNLIANYVGVNPTALIGQYTRMWICGVAYDSYLTDSQGPNVNDNQFIYPILAVGSPDWGKQSVSFTNQTGGNLCGTITYPTVNDPVLLLSTLPWPLAQPVDNAIAAYKRQIIIAYADLFIKMNLAGSAIPFPCLGGFPCVLEGSLGATARDFACGFVNSMMDNPNIILNNPPMNCNYMGYCNSGAPGSDDLPDVSCIITMITSANASILGAQAAAKVALNGFIGGPQFIIDVQQRGWAGMGIWYHRIESMNAAVSDMKIPKISMTGGDPSNGGLGAHHAEKVKEMLHIYDQWWLNLQNDPASDIAAPAPVVSVLAGATNFLKAANTLSSAKNFVFGLATASPLRMMDALADMVGDEIGKFIFYLSDPADNSTYPLAKLAKMGEFMMAASIAIYGVMGLVEVFGTGFACGLTVEYGVQAATLGTFNTCGAVGELAESALPPMILTMASLIFMAGLMMRYYIPLLPFISVAHSVLTWMISVFEAVMMVPLAALSHLTTEGDGIAGSHSRQVWILWLNVLMRPVLTVIGYVASFLIFNTFVVFLSEAFAATALSGFTAKGMIGFVAKGMYSIIYVFIIYTAATSCFKLLDLIPDSLFRWMGGGTPDRSFDTSAHGALGSLGAVSGAMSSGFGKSKKGYSKAGGPKATGGGGKQTTLT